MLNCYTISLHEQILELKKKQESQVELLKQKHKSDEAAKRLQAEIQSIKAQKVRFFFPYVLGAYAKFRSDMQDILLSIDNPWICWAVPHFML